MREFDHEKLHVYQSAIHFVKWSTELLETLPGKIAVHNQLDRASTSIPLNIAEGNAESSPPQIVAATLILLVGRRWSALLVSMCFLPRGY